MLWKPTRKHITFVKDDEQRVRDRDINSTFNMNVSKEELEREFIRNNEYRQSRIRNVRTELGRTDGKIKCLNDIIDSYKKLSKEQAKMTEQKDVRIKRLEEEKLKLEMIIKELDELNQSLRTDYLENDRKTNEINKLRSSTSYLSSLNKGLEEEGASLKARIPWWRK